MEKIKIENFAGIKSMDFEFKSINILIGPQGSGKSVTVKLLYFFKNFFTEILRSIESEESKRELDKKQKEKFLTFFPRESWPKGNFKIIYVIENIEIRLEKSNNQLIFDYSENLKRIISKIRKVYLDEKKKANSDPKRSSYMQKIELRNKIEKCLRNNTAEISTYSQFFIPAGRSFFANIQKSIFSFLSDNRSLDPFLIEFGSFYENLKQIYRDKDFEKNIDKKFEELISDILESNYVREKDKDYLVHKDNRKVNLSNASSGQQETLPLVVILKVLNIVRFNNSGATIYIEEPEAHLFPIAQKAIVRLLAKTFNNKTNKFQIIVTTHSPYILSSFNNLLQAGRLSSLKSEQAQKISKIVPVNEQINPDLLTAYSLSHSKRESLIEHDSKLISQTILDSVSNEIAVDFGNLLDIEF